MDNYNSYFQFGAQAIKNDPEHVYNSSLLFSTEGKMIDRYNKNRLVAFGEIIPFNKIVNKLTNKKWHSLTAGEKYNIFEINDVKWRTFICSEILYPMLSDNLKDFDFIVNQSNEAWFENGLQKQMWSAAIFRAVESRKTVIKAGNRAISGVIMPSGKIQEMKAVNNINAIKTKITLNKENTFYNKYGNYPGYIALIIVIILYVINSINKFNKNKMGSEKDEEEI